MLFARLLRHPPPFHPRQLRCVARPASRALHASPPRATTLPPALLRRAESLAAERERLDAQLQLNFDGVTARRVGALTLVSQALDGYQAGKKNVAELTTMLNEKNLDPELRTLAEMDFAETNAELATLAQSISHALVPTHPFAHLPALIEIRPGTGGSEAALFANDLYRMYMAYCNIKGWPVSMVSMHETEGADGVLEAIFEVGVDGAYNEFRTEAGVHRVQRIPVTETKGRTHTSTATVMVLPSFPVEEVEGEEDPDSVIDMKDVRIDIMRARGAGGQHVNTTDSAVRMTHIPTGTVAAIQDSRSQHKNRAKCLMVLKSRIAQKRRDEREAEELALRRGAAKVGAGRSDKMRTYNYSQNRVTDHRAGFSLHDLPGCMKGEELGRMIEEVKKWKMGEEVEMLTAEED